MIITEKKDFKEIVDSLAGKKSVFLYGCGACAEQCRTGGEKEIEEISAKLKESGFEVLGSSILQETCYRQRVVLDIKKKKEIKEADSILVLACGAGVKTVAECVEPSQPVFPALDSMYLATVERYGRFFEGCSLCGECVLADTAGICPHTECPKGLLNGPCGGVVGGRCEVDLENDCAWIKIYNRLKAQDRVHLMKKYHPLKDHSVGTRPRKTLLRAAPAPRG